MVFFPTRKEFDAAGRPDLRCAVSDFGGTLYWADRLGLELRPGQDRNYTVADAVVEARAVVAERGHLIAVRRLREDGHGLLASVVQRYGGSRRFSERYDLS
jgi:hypothetical protein